MNVKSIVALVMTMLITGLMTACAMTEMSSNPDITNTMDTNINAKTDSQNTQTNSPIATIDNVEKCIICRIKFSKIFHW